MSSGSLRSISRINVRIIALICFILVLLAVGYIIWRLSSLEPQYAYAPAPRQRAPTPSGEWHGAEHDDTPWAPDSPFSSDHLTALAQRAKQREAAARAAAQQEATATTNLSPESTKPPVAVEPPPQNRTIALVCRGMFTRTDGSSVAVVEHLDTGRTVLLGPGDKTEGLALKHLDRTGATLCGPDASREYVLPVGKRVEITIPKKRRVP